MHTLAWRNLWRRPARTIFAALAIALGAAMIFAARVVTVAAEASAAETRNGRLAGADIEISSITYSAIGAEIAERVAALPDVARAAPIYRRLEGRIEPSGAGMDALLSGDPRGAGLALLGVDPANALIPYDLAAGQFFGDATGDEVLVPRTWAAVHGVGVGDMIGLTTGIQRREYRVIGLLRDDLQSVVSGKPTAWLPLATMQRAFDAPGAATAVQVRLMPGIDRAAARDRIAAALGSQFVVTDDSGSRGERNVLELLLDAALPFAGLAVLLTGAFLVYNAFAITLIERRREIAQLRTLGMTRGQTIRLVLVESLLIALLGVAAGVLLGLLFGQGMVWLVVGILQDAAIPTFALPLDGVILAVGSGVLITLAVAFTLAREAAGIEPLAALRAEADHEAARGWYLRYGPYGAIIALALFIAASIWVFRQGRAYSGGFTPLLSIPFLLAFAALLALPLVLRGAQRLAVWLMPRLGVAGRLAVGNLARRPERALITSATLSIGLMLVVGLSGVLGSMRNFQQTAFSPLLGGDFLLIRSLTGISFAQSGAAPSPPPMTPELQRQLDGLADQAEFLRLANLMLPGYGAGPEIENGFALDFALYRNTSAFAIAEGSWEEFDRYAAQERVIILPELSARRLDLHPGDVAMIETREGPAPFTVGMVGGSLPTISVEDGARYFQTYPIMIMVHARPGVDHAALEAELQRIADRYGIVFAGDPNAIFQTILDSLFGSLLAMFTGLTSISSVIAGFAIANTLVAAVYERQREIGALRAIGMTRDQIRRMIVFEAGWMGAIGAGWGAIAGLAIGLAFDGVSTQIGSALGVGGRWIPKLPWEIALVAVIVGPTIAMLAALYPADRATAVNPAEAMRAEGAGGFLKPAAHLGPTGLRGLFARTSLAVKIALALSLVFAITIAGLTAARARAERRLLEENVIALMERQSNLMLDTLRDEFPMNLLTLTPQSIRDLRRRMQEQPGFLQQRFQEGRSPYEFGLEYYLLVDPAGKVVDSDRPEYLGRVLSDTLLLTGGSGTAVRTTDWTGDRAYEGTVPLQRRDGRRIGYAVLGVTTEPVDNIIADIVRESLWISAAALIVALLLTWLITRRALGPLALIVEASRAIAAGDLTRQIPENRWDEIGRLARAFNEMVRGLSDRERMRDLFGRYLSREVSEVVLAGKVSLAGERRIVSVVFCDMRDSTPFAERLEPEAVMLALNEYFEVIIRATEAHGGIVARFLGDGTMCSFGAPYEVPDHAERAVRATLRIRRDLAELNRRRAALDQPTLRFGMGISSGPVTAGATGAEHRQEYTIIGDTVNLAARVEGLTKEFPQYDIMLSEQTIAALGSRAQEYQYDDLGVVEIKGKSQAVRIFGLTAYNEQSLT
jgi:class 3 adenylate cyclase/ABC-type antimicrobial peptide transport system permease subunit